ncbi:molecular chaperone GrpE [Marvinbryantia formatexigens]|nr:nucleotide exchange factor GrpE [Marvinbryantia formatexigens]SDF59192.1 molecular chaperone GrpE [Marvinbryantia formatexigens]
MAEENMEKDMDEAIEKNTQEEEAPETEEASRQQKASEPAEETEEAPQKESKKDKKDAQIEELQDRVKRQMAEFENFRKRSEKEKSKMFEMGAKSVIEQLLPIVDNFERGLAAVSEEAKEDAFVSGMDKVYRQMTEMLDKLGVKPIEAVGCEFNPDFHNAVMHVEEEDTAENTITEEFLKGYTYKDQVVRHSMVKVAN